MSDGMRTAYETASQELASQEAKLATVQERVEVLRDVKSSLGRLLGLDEPTAQVPPPDAPRGKYAVRAVMAEKPHPYRWRVPAIRDAVLEAGWIEPSNRVTDAIRTNLMRAVETFDEIYRVGTGEYVFDVRRVENDEDPTVAGSSSSLFSRQQGGDGNATVTPIAN